MPGDELARDRGSGVRGRLGSGALIGGGAALLYLLAAQIGFELAFVAEQITTVWAPTGIALATLLLYGTRFWPAVWLGAFAANATASAPLWTALVIATGNTLEAVAAVWVLRRTAAFSDRLQRVSDVVAFLLVAGIACTTISATIGVSVLCAANVQPWDQFAPLWWNWWFGDALGATIVAPAILTTLRHQWSRRHAAQAATFLACALIVTYIGFGLLPSSPHPFEYIVFPLVIAAAVAGGPPVTSLAVLGVSGLAIWHTVRGSGPFADGDVYGGLVLLQVFLSVLSATSLLLAAAVSERRASEERQREAAAGLRLREEQLAEANKELARRVREQETLLDVLPIGIGIATDRECREIRINRAFARTLGLSPSTNASKTAPAGERPTNFRVFTPEGAEVPDADLPMQVAAREGSNVHEMELDIVHDDGRVVRLLEYASPLLDEQGQPRGAIGAFVDVTAAHHARATLKQSEERLRQEVEIRATLAHVGASLAGELHSDKLIQAVTDASTRLTEAEFGAFFYKATDDRGDSDALYSLSGTPREAFASFPPLRATEVFGPTFRGEAIIRLDDVTKDPRYASNVPNDGMPPAHLPVRSYLAVPVIGRGGVVLGGLFFGHSRAGVFTERHELLASGVAAWAAIALDNARLYQDAEDASRLKDEFLATLSHELRTPLNAVLGWAHMLREGAMEPAMYERALESLERNAQAQAQLVEDLLDVSGIIAGKLQMKSEPVDLEAVVTNAVETVRAGVAAKRLSLQVHVPDGKRLLVTGDADRLQQVVWNLVSNAVKFTPAGGRVDVELHHVDARAEFVVRDTGQGIDPSFRPHLFQRFRQMDASKTRVHGGLGLGLSIVRHLVEAHGGTVDAESEGLGRGATFRVRLPLRILERKRSRPDSALPSESPSTPIS